MSYDKIKKILEEVQDTSIREVQEYLAQNWENISGRYKYEFGISFLDKGQVLKVSFEYVDSKKSTLPKGSKEHVFNRVENIYNELKNKFPELEFSSLSDESDLFMGQYFIHFDNAFTIYKYDKNNTYINKDNRESDIHVIRVEDDKFLFPHNIGKSTRFYLVDFLTNVGLDLNNVDYIRYNQTKHTPWSGAEYYTKNIVVYYKDGTHKELL